MLFLIIFANPALTQANYTQISDGNVVFENYSDDGTHLVMTQIDLGESKSLKCYLLNIRITTQNSRFIFNNIN